MEVKEALLKRRSVRKFLSKEVPQEDITYLLEAAMSGPSACNKAPWEFYVVTNKDKLNELKTATRYSSIEAPLAIIVVGNMSRALPSIYNTYWIQDCSAASENILLAAVDRSLGSVWCGVYPEKENELRVKEILSLSDEQVPLNIVYIGYPDENVQPRTQFKERNVYYIK